ncbi:MAG: hypothetical protein HRT47_10410 [Candidatus Caenarcaniphilales bacterium]|nr:hypothetical protein [Candidatus Caenarcaniphilales bacterium]
MANFSKIYQSIKATSCILPILYLSSLSNISEVPKITEPSRNCLNKIHSVEKVSEEITKDNKKPEDKNNPSNDPLLMILIMSATGLFGVKGIQAARKTIEAFKKGVIEGYTEANVDPHEVLIEANKINCLNLNKYIESPLKEEYMAKLLNKLGLPECTEVYSSNVPLNEWKDCNYILILEKHSRKDEIENLIENNFWTEICVRFVESEKSMEKPVQPRIRNRDIDTYGWDHDNVEKMKNRVLFETIVHLSILDPLSKSIDKLPLSNNLKEFSKQLIKKCRDDNFYIKKRNDSLIKTINESKVKEPFRKKIFTLGADHVYQDSRIEQALKNLNQKYIILDLTRAKTDIRF